MWYANILQGYNSIDYTERILTKFAIDFQFPKKASKAFGNSLPMDNVFFTLLTYKPQFFTTFFTRKTVKFCIQKYTYLHLVPFCVYAKKQEK